MRNKHKFILRTILCTLLLPLYVSCDSSQLQSRLATPDKSETFDGEFAQALATGLEPFIKGAGAGCANGFCIWIAGTRFTDSSEVEIRSAVDGQILYRYTGGHLMRVYNGAEHSITLSLHSYQERYQFATSGLNIRVFTENGASQFVHVKTYVSPPPPPVTAPTIQMAGPGCADGFCVWIAGTGFTTTSVVETRDPVTGKFLRRYADGNLGRVLDANPQAHTISLATYEERVLFATTGISITVINNGVASNAQTIRTNSPVPQPPAPPVPTPVIQNAGYGCADGFCIWIQGTGFTESSEVEVRSTATGQFLRKYAAGNLGKVLNVNPQGMTLSLVSLQERTLFATTGLTVSVLNGTLVSNLKAIKTVSPAPTPPSPTPVPTPPAPTPTPPPPPPTAPPATTQCSGDYVIADVPWGADVKTYQAGGFRVGATWVGRLRVPANATSPNNLPGTVSFVEYIDGQAERIMTISTQPCDFRGFTPGVFPKLDPTGATGIMAFSTGINPNFQIALFSSPVMFPAKPRLVPGNTYYINIRNVGYSTGTNSCHNSSGSCNGLLTVTGTK